MWLNNRIGTIFYPTLIYGLLYLNVISIPLSTAEYLPGMFLYVIPKMTNTIVILT